MKLFIHPFHQLLLVKRLFILPGFILILTGCSSPLIKTNPSSINDTSAVTITCIADKGNEGLKDFNGDVFVHLGLITDSSLYANEWRYVKFKWGSTEKEALAKPAGPNKWSYTIPNIREFFTVSKNEKILQLAILFREGNCIDTFCRVLRNKDKSDILIPLKN